MGHTAMVSCQGESDTDDGSEIDIGSVLTHFQRDAVGFAKHWVGEFFKGRKMYCGGSIPTSLLYSDRQIDRVLNLSVGDAVSQAHEMLTTSSKYSSNSLPDDEDGVPVDVRFVIDVIGEQKQQRVPKCCQGGILLMYLEICEGLTPNKQNISAMSF